MLQCKDLGIHIIIVYNIILCVDKMQYYIAFLHKITHALLTILLLLLLLRSDR